jgi:hypothetical protein
VHELSVHHVQDGPLLANGEDSQMLFSIRGVFNAVGQWFLPLSFIGHCTKLGRLTPKLTGAVKRPVQRQTV